MILSPLSAWPISKGVAGLRREARDILLRFGIAEEILNEYLKLLPQLGTGESLKFQPLDVPHPDLDAEGFKL